MWDADNREASEPVCLLGLCAQSSSMLTQPWARERDSALCVHEHSQIEIAFKKYARLPVPFSSRDVSSSDGVWNIVSKQMTNQIQCQDDTYVQAILFAFLLKAEKKTKQYPVRFSLEPSDFPKKQTNQR